MSSTETRTADGPRDGGSAPTERPVLVIVWADDPAHLGAVLSPPAGGRYVVGRGDRSEEDPHPRLAPRRQRPGRNETGGPITDSFISRQQLALLATDDGVEIENIGKTKLVGPSGAIVKRCKAVPGDLVEVKGRLLLLCVARSDMLPKTTTLERAQHAFGEADERGIIGESPVIWTLRDNAAFVARRSAHVLLLGESGTGKELVAQMIHRLSGRRARKLVTRNAATLPSGLIDAELFGHVANYPNAGMPERPGLVAEADGGTLFLDEIGELAPELQTRLLRVLDDKGEYQRLGDPRARTSDLRLIGATNRNVGALKHDLAARFRLRVHVPSLAQRREDIPLIARHLLRTAAIEDPDIGGRFLAGWNGRTGEPRIAIDLVRELVRHPYTTHVRELDALLWTSLGSSPGGVAELTPEVSGALDVSAADPPEGAARVDVRQLTAEDIRAALARAGGKYEQATRELGLANRHVLKRLVRKFGLREDG